MRLRRSARDPRIDPTTSGISFVDILFALAVGEVLLPLVPWAANHTAHSMPAPIVWNLAAAIVLILTSFIGYHNSENRPRFTIRFINISFCKFFLDISMVIVYFLFASFASVTPAQTQSLLLLVLLVFGLYLLWDFAGWYEKKRGRYKQIWEKAYADPNRPDIVDAWTDVNYWRAFPTLIGLVLAAALYGWSLHQSTPLPNNDVVIVNIGVIGGLLAYRIAKDWIPDKKPSSTEKPSNTSVTITLNVNAADLATGVSIKLLSSTRETSTGDVSRTAAPSGPPA
jgi:hypothetical protein